MGFSNQQWHAPANWQDFQQLCCFLWSEIWDDPDTRQVGRPGFAQHGVDIVGRPNRGASWAGVQCKGKDNYAQNTLTDPEVRAEVEKAKAFDQPLSQFIIATTGHVDPEIQELARQLTAEHVRSGLFSVGVCFWPEIVELIGRHEKVAEWYMKQCGLAGSSLQREVAEVKDIAAATLAGVRAVSQRFSSLGPQETGRSLATEYKAQLEEIKRMLNVGKPHTAKRLATKLKGRAWRKLKALEKFRLTNQLAIAAWQLGREREAGRLLVRALRFNPDNDVALANCAAGLLLLDKRQRAALLAQRALKKNRRNCAAYGVLVRVTPGSRSTEELAQTVPKACRSKPPVALALAEAARRQGSIADAARWLRVAVANDKEGTPELKAALADTLLELASGAERLEASLVSGATTKNHFAEAKQLYEDACAKVRHTETYKRLAPWSANLANACWMTGDTERATSAVDEALAIEPGSADYIKVKAAVEQECGRTDEAIKLLGSIRQNPKTQDVALLLSLLLLDKHEYARARGVLDELITTGRTGVRVTAAKLIRARLLAETGDAVSAMAAVREVLDVESPSIHTLVLAARVADAVGKSSEGQGMLSSAVALVGNGVDARDVMGLADDLAKRKQYGEAALLFERLGAREPDSPLAVRLLQCYYNDGDLGKALVLCRNLDARHGLQRRVSAMVPAILEEIGDFMGAAAGYARYLAHFPDDVEPRFHLAHVNLRLGRMAEVDAFLEKPPEGSGLTPAGANNLAVLYAERGKYRQAMDVMYELRRQHYDDHQAHLGLFGIWIRMTQAREDAWLGDSKVAGLNTAVQVKEQDGSKRWYIIEDRADADLAKGELVPSHPTAQALLGKKPGDTVRLADDGVSSITVEVLEIKSKYAWAVADIGDTLPTLFPGKPGFWRFHVDTDGDREELLASLRPVIEQIKGRQESAKQVEQLYRGGRLTIGAYALLLGQHPLDVWGHLTSAEGMWLRVLWGNPSPGVAVARSLLVRPRRLVVDAIALATIHSLNVGDLVVQSFGRLGITQSTIELLEAGLAENKAKARDGLKTMGAAGDTPVMSEIPAEAFARNVALLEKILAWCANNCDVVPVSGALQLRRESREQLGKMIGESFLDSALAAMGECGLLYSDDQGLRGLAEQEYHVQGLCTQQLLTACVQRAKITVDVYQDAIIKLMSMRYRHTWFDADILLTAAREANWRLEPPFSLVVSEAGDEHIDLPRLAVVVADFMFRLQKEDVVGAVKDTFVTDLLTAAAHRRPPRQFADALRRAMRDKYWRDNRVWVTSTEPLIDAWLRTHPEVRRK